MALAGLPSLPDALLNASSSAEDLFRYCEITKLPRFELGSGQVHVDARFYRGHWEQVLGDSLYDHQGGLWRHGS